MILGGLTRSFPCVDVLPLTRSCSFLTLPATFDSDPQLRVNKNVLSIFSVALLTFGLSTTALLCFACRNWSFQIESIFIPALTASTVGLLTIFYSFLISSRYYWNTAALLLTIAAAIATIIYSLLLFLTYRKVATLRSPRNNRGIPLRSNSFDSGRPVFQDTSYQRNYIANMWPSALSSPHHPPPEPPAQVSFSEDELTRQQMLNLLMQKPDRAPSPDPTQGSFNRIEWEYEPQTAGTVRDPPLNGWYAPSRLVHPQPGYAPPGTSAHLESQVSPWTGTGHGSWRTGSLSGQGIRMAPHVRSASREERERRRREIETGLVG